MDKSAFYKLTYGMYVVSALDKDGKKVGCIANTAIQVTSTPSQILVSLNHQNDTNRAIQETGKLAIGILGEEIDPLFIQTFGFKSSRDTDKFASFPYMMKDSIPVPAGVLSYFLLTIKKTIELETHTLFIGEVTEAENLIQGNPMTYSYYHQVLKGMAPKNAPTYQGKPEEKKENKKFHHFRCLVCGYVQETEEEELPPNYTCPVCGATRDQFEKID
ncbi:MAG: flavin reductase [Bacilli bacterium]|jgi:flavin reductase (DIM6/NTAB) family NADH-FMN oxidoreductase RutF/rubredoxin|nr:flavin reductase [Bacilli bacterium]